MNEDERRSQLPFIFGALKTGLSGWMIFTGPGTRGTTMTKLNPKTVILSMAAAAAAGAIALPGLASAESCYDKKHDARTTGAVVGAVAGAAVGNAAAGRHDRGTGTVLGAVVGAAVGSNIARNNTHCYYDDGYYDRSDYNGRGYYGNGGHGGGYARTDVEVYGNGDGDRYYRREEHREWRDGRREDRREWREDRRDDNDD